MKKAILILLVGLFWCNVAQAESSLPECEGSPFMVQAATEGDLIKILTGKLFKKWTNCHGVIDAEELGEFSGEFKDGKLKKEGVYIASDGGKYIGEFKDDNPLKKFHGQGAYTYSSGEKYVGKWKNGSKDGQGTYTFPDGTKYVGEFKKDKYHGQGTLKKADGQKYVGEFKNNSYNGQGTLIAPGFGEYTGQFKDDLPNGKVVITIIEDDSYGDLSGSIYEGKVKNAIPTYGTLTYKNGDKYIGNFKDGQLNGKGTLTYADGKIEKGIWKDGELVK